MLPFVGVAVTSTLPNMYPNPPCTLTLWVNSKGTGSPVVILLNWSSKLQENNERKENTLVEQICVLSDS